MTAESAKPSLNLVKCCCRDQELTGYISPFHRVIALEHGAGDHLGRDTVPVAGVAQCGKCKCCWLYALRERRGDLAVYTLRKAQSSALDSLIEVYSPLKKPKWPIWIPPGEVPRQHQERIKEVEDGIWEHADQPTVAIALKNLTTGRLVASAKLKPGQEVVRGWFTLLGVQ